MVKSLDYGLFGVRFFCSVVILLPFPYISLQKSKLTYAKYMLKMGGLDMGKNGKHGIL